MITVYEYHPYSPMSWSNYVRWPIHVGTFAPVYIRPHPSSPKFEWRCAPFTWATVPPMHCPRMCVPCWSLTKFERCGMRFENTTGVGGVTLTLDVQSGDYSILLKNTCILQDVCLYSLSSLFMYYLSSFPLVHVFPDVPSSFHYRHMQNWVFQLLA